MPAKRSRPEVPEAARAFRGADSIIPHEPSRWLLDATATYMSSDRGQQATEAARRGVVVDALRHWPGIDPVVAERLCDHCERFVESGDAYMFFRHSIGKRIHLIGGLCLECATVEFGDARVEAVRSS